jgi:sodium-dependent dicarboxylate transporter 2/3/5
MLSRIPNPLVFWKLWVAVLAPVLLLPVPLLGAPDNRDALWCGWTILVMAVFWISECLPLAITSLLPLVLLPLAGVLGTKEVKVITIDDDGGYYDDDGGGDCP